MVELGEGSEQGLETPRHAVRVGKSGREGELPWGLPGEIPPTPPPLGEGRVPASLVQPEESKGSSSTFPQAAPVQGGQL